MLASFSLALALHAPITPPSHSAALLGIVLLVQGRAGRAYGYRSQVSADNSAFAFLTSPFRRPASAGRWGRISPPVVGPEEHPMAALMREGEKRWHALLARQSTSLEQAVKEYQRRYGRRPPKGFDLWYRWSTERGLKLVDGALFTSQFETLKR